MGIKEVSYERLFSFGQYENEKLRLNATVDDGQTAEKVLGELVTKVTAIEDVLETYRESIKNCQGAEDKLRRINGEVMQLETSIANMKVKIEEISARLERGEVDVDGKLRHACDRQSYKESLEHLQQEKEALVEAEIAFKQAVNDRDVLKKRILEGDFNLEGLTVIKPLRRYSDY